MLAFLICTAIIAVLAAALLLKSLLNGTDSVSTRRLKAAITWAFLSFLSFVLFWVAVGSLIASGSKWNDIQEPALMVNGVLITMLVSSMRYLFRVERANKKG